MPASGYEWEARQRTVYSPEFDLRSWVEEACDRSGVPFAVEDPVALSKLRVLTRSDT